MNSIRQVITLADPFLVQLLTKRNPLGTVIHRPTPDIPQVSLSPRELATDMCSHVETDMVGVVVKKCFNHVHTGRSGFLCKMHHDLNVKLKPLGRTIHLDNSDQDESKLRNKLQLEVQTSRGKNGHSYHPFLDYTTYSQWGWSKQPVLFVQDEFGEMSQAFIDPELEEVE